MAPLQTARESFDLKQLSSDLCLKLVSLQSSLVVDFMTRSTDHQRLAAACGHPLDPERFFTPAWLVQIRQLADVVNLTVRLRLPRSRMTPKTVSAFRISRT